MKRAAGSTQRGSSLFEFVVTVILVTILVGIAANRISLIHGRYEAVAMQGVLGSLRSALGITLVARVVGKDKNAIAALDGCNPFELLQQTPKNYGGVVDDGAPSALKPGWWYFDSASGEVIYRVRADKWIKTELPGPARVRFRVTLDFTDRNGDGRFTPGTDSLHGIDLRALDDYSWHE